MKNVLGLLWGAQLGWIKPELIMATEAETESSIFAEMVQFRKKQHDLIYGGRFMKEVIPWKEITLYYTCPQWEQPPP